MNRLIEEINSAPRDSIARELLIEKLVVDLTAYYNEYKPPEPKKNHVDPDYVTVEFFANFHGCYVPLTTLGKACTKYCKANGIHIFQGRQGTDKYPMNSYPEDIIRLVHDKKVAENPDKYTEIIAP